EARVEVEVALREVHVVADDLGLGELGQPRRRRAAEALGQRVVAARDVELGADERAAPGRALLEDRARVALGAHAAAGVGVDLDARVGVQLVVGDMAVVAHAWTASRSAATAAPTTSTSRSMSARVRRSVSATSSPSSSSASPGLMPCS